MDGKYIDIGLSINGSEFEEFDLRLDGELAIRLEKIYREESAKVDFDNATFWQKLKANHADMADSIRKAIVEKLTGYIFTDEWVPENIQSDRHEVETVDPNTLFPLADLHFDYLTADSKPTIRHLDCEKCVIYDDNEFDCDFSESFDS